MRRISLVVLCFDSLNRTGSLMPFVCESNYTGCAVSFALINEPSYKIHLFVNQITLVPLLRFFLNKNKQCCLFMNQTILAALILNEAFITPC